MVHLGYYRKKRNRFPLAWSRPCTERGEIEPELVYSVQQEIAAKFHPDRSTSGENGSRKNLFTTHNGGRPLPCGHDHQKRTKYRIRSVVSVAYISSIFWLFGSLNLSFSGCDSSFYESVPVTGKRPPKRSRQSWLAVVQENSVFSVRLRSASGYHFEGFSRGAICFDWNCSILVR